MDLSSATEESDVCCVCFGILKDLRVGDRGLQLIFKNGTTTSTVSLTKTEPCCEGSEGCEGGTKCRRSTKRTQLIILDTGIILGHHISGTRPGISRTKARFLQLYGYANQKK